MEAADLADLEETAEDPPLLVGEAGRKYVREALTQRDPKAVIDEMHAALGLPALVPTAGPLLSLLDLLGTTRADVHASVMDALRARLLEEVERLPQERLLALLRRVIPYMGVPEVTPVCTALLGRCGSIPLEVLDVLAQPDNYVRAARTPRARSTMRAPAQPSAAPPARPSALARCTRRSRRVSRSGRCARTCCARPSSRCSPRTSPTRPTRPPRTTCSA